MGDDAAQYDLEDKVAVLEGQLKGVYSERAQLVALLATLHPSYMNAHDDSGNYRVVYVELPTGQVSWHIHPDDLWWFNHVRTRTQPAELWDGHDNATKRVRMLSYINRMAI